MFEKLPSYEVSWRTAPEKRPISPLVLAEIAALVGTAPVSSFTGASSLLTLPYTTLHPIAKGARPSGPFRAMEDRATIRGGVTVLRAAGVKGYKADPKTLVSGIVATPADDKKLIAAAGGGKTLKEAAARIRRVVTRAKLDKAAFASRALFIAGNAVGFDIYAQVGLAIAGAGVGTAIGASRDALNKLTNPDVRKFGEVLAREMRRIKARRAKAKKAAPRGAAPRGAAPGAPGVIASQATTVAAPVAAMPIWPWVVGGVLCVVLGVAYLRRSR